MSGIDEAMREDQENQEIIKFLKYLVSCDVINDDTLLGIVSFLFKNGFDKLSEKQSYVLNKFIEKFKSENQCNMCEGMNMHYYQDYIEVYEGSNCNDCQRNFERMEDE